MPKRDLEKFAETPLAKKRTHPSLFPSDTTVSIGVTGEDGKMKYSEPIPHSDFVKLGKKVAKAAKQARAH